MREDQPLDHLNSTSLPNLFTVLSTGFLFGTSLSLPEWMIYQLLQDVFLTIELNPATVLWSTNIVTSVIHVVLIFVVFLSAQKKIRNHKLNWKKMLDQSKYFFAVSILLQVLFMVYWTRILPDSFYISLDLFNFAASESLLYTILPILFSVINVLLVLLFLKRLSEEFNKVEK
ncbi:MAG: hypothetical protein HWE22_19400 [Flavobacteriales bacterium]|nr:hypothetical protein [Flavobacteriales bacterium]